MAPRCRRSASSPAGLGHPARRHGARHAEAAARGRRRAVPAPSAPAAGRPRRPARSCSASATSASRSSERIGRRQFGIDDRLQLRRAAARSGRSARSARPRRCSATRFLVLYGDTYLRIDYGAAARAWERQRAAGADDRAAQRGPLGHLERRASTDDASPLRQARADAGDELDRLRARRADGRRARARRSRTSTTSPTSTTSSPRAASCSASPRPSGSTRSGPRRRSPRRASSSRSSSPARRIRRRNGLV